MTFVDLSALAIYGVAAVQLGRGALKLFPTRSPLLAGWAPALLAGQLVLTATALLTGLLPLSLPWIGLGLLAMTAASTAHDLLRYRQRKEPNDGSELRWSILTAGTLLVLYPNVVFWILRRPVVDWDARSIWFFHARVLFADGGLDPSVFTDPSYLHSGYPLWLSVQGAWISVLRQGLTGDGWSDVAVKSFLLLNFAAYFHLLWKLLRARGFPWWLGLAATVLFLDAGPRLAGHDGFGYGYVCGYADAHYAAAFLLALLAFSLPRSEGGPELGVLLLAFGANVKLESGFYAFLLAGGVGLALGLLGIRRKLQMPWRLVLAGFALGGIPMVLWTGFRSIHGIGSHMDPLHWLGDPQGVFALVGDRASLVASTLAGLFADRGGLWLLALWVVFLLWGAVQARTGRGAGFGRAELAGAAALLVVPTVIFLMYALTPLELEVHLRTSADRLLFFPLALLYGLMLLALARGMDARKQAQLGGVS